MTKIAAYDYHLPPELIAQHPVDPRDAARLLVLNRATGEIQHRSFSDIVDYLSPGDLLVVNNTRVIAARLHGRLPTGGRGEVFLLRPLDGELLQWEALVRPGRKLQPGDKLLVDGTEIQVESRPRQGTVITVEIPKDRRRKIRRELLSPLAAGAAENLAGAQIAS